MTDDLSTTLLDDEQQSATEPTADAPDPEPEPVVGLTLVKSEWHGDHGDEHHWFSVPAGHSAADYQAELDVFIEQRATITLDDVTVTAV